MTRRLFLWAFEGVLGLSVWIAEVHRRWPAVIGVLRGKTVVYAATLGPPGEQLLYVDNPRGAVVMDSFFRGTETLTL